MPINTEFGHSARFLLSFKTASVRWRPLKNRPSFDPHKLRYPQFVSYSIYFMAEADGVQFPNALHQQTDQVDDQYPLEVLPEQGGVVPAPNENSAAELG